MMVKLHLPQGMLGGGGGEGGSEGGRARRAGELLALQGRQRREENLDARVGGSKLREPQRGSVLFEGPGGVDERPGNRRMSRQPNQRNSYVTPEAGDNVRASVVPIDILDGGEETTVNWGRTGPQTVVASSVEGRQLQQVEYQGTEEMRIPVSPEREE